MQAPAPKRAVRAAFDKAADSYDAVASVQRAACDRLLQLATRSAHQPDHQPARILDAGCGPGRLGGRLHGLGHRVVGVDVDPALIAAAEEDHPGPLWLVGDLAELDLPARGIDAGFDVIVSAGNVMGFLAPSTRVAVLRRFAGHLAAGGRAIIGFGAGRGYEFPEFLADANAAGLELDQAFSTWDLRPFLPDSDFLVAILTAAE